MAKKYDGYNWDELVLFMFFELDTYLKKLFLKFKNEKLAPIANHLHQIRGRSMETMTVEGEHLRGYVAIGASPCSSLRSRHTTVMIMYVFCGDKSQ